MGTWEGEEQRDPAPIGGSAIARRFEDLEVWKTGRLLAQGVYRAAQKQPLGRDRAMADQMKRAAVSVAANIAEGYERGTRRQNIELCYYAKGSAGELRSHVRIARDVELIDEATYTWFIDTCEKCSKQLATYIRHLEGSSDSIPGMKFASVRNDSKRKQ